MISTVTTTVTTIASTTMAAGLGLLATLALIFLLIAKELAGAQNVQAAAGGTGSVSFAGALDRVLNVAIVPLLIVFSFIVAVKIIEVLH